MMKLLRCRNRVPKVHRLQRCLSKEAIEDDGYGYHGYQGKEQNAAWQKLLSGKPKPGTLILVRHGESEWNQQRRFTGWVDVDLSDIGRREVEHAAKLLVQRGYSVDVAYTSMLKRAIRSSWIILKELGQVYRPAIKSWRLNERMYGGLEGLSKSELAVALGEDVVQKWRDGLIERPPEMTRAHVHWHGNEAKYKNLDPALIPTTESLQDTIDRTVPLLQMQILPDIQAGRNVLIVAHANSLRGILKYIDNLGTLEIQKVSIPNGIPLVYKFDDKMVPIKQPKAVMPLSGYYLEKKTELRAKLEKQMAYERNVTATTSNNHYSVPNTPHESIAMEQISAVDRAEQHKKLLQLFAEHNLHSNSATLTHGRTATTNVAGSEGYINERGLDSRMSIDYGMSADVDKVNTTINSRITHNCSTLDGPLLVIIRHGKTEHNKLGLFTGWEDAPLATEGVDEASQAGKLLRRHGVQFDVVYTSWLSRAIETAWLALNELDLLWVPIVKTWRLNERMYGALTGLSKKMVRQQYGNTQFMLWRRSYETRPPEISSFSHFYPGNDDRYVNYVADVEISIFESLIRSLAHGKLEIHRRFPKSESLKDCMDRTIPYFKKTILPRMKSKGQTKVLIASSENAIRGLLMHLCDIEPDRIQDVEIPTGLPMLFDWKAKRIRLFDDGDDRSPFEKYDFGKDPELLFKPVIPGVKIVRKGQDASSTGKDDGSYVYDPIIWLPDKSTSNSLDKATLTEEDHQLISS